VQAEKSVQVQRYCLLANQEGWKKMLSPSIIQGVLGAAIGLIIVLLGVTLGGQMPAWFGKSTSGCTLS